MGIPPNDFWKYTFKECYLVAEHFHIQNNLDYTYKKYSNKKEIDKLLPFLENDKKNNDGRINFILLNHIGKTTLSNQNKISLKHLRGITQAIAQY